MKKLFSFFVLLSGLFMANIYANNGNFSAMNKNSVEFVLNHPANYDSPVTEDSVSGFGTLTYPTGERYVGNFKKGLKNGNGYIKYPDGREYYGDFKDDQIEGYGSLYFPNGEKYVGNFKNGQFNGEGTFTASNGTTKTGIYKDNVYTGVN
ncbi:MAG TPA: hypothetical protein PKW80_09805 [Bacteroidales bacterium]|nr:hypothetical protein [Bacteroidales bacterium]